MCMCVCKYSGASVCAHRCVCFYVEVRHQHQLSFLSWQRRFWDRSPLLTWNSPNVLEYLLWSFRNKPAFAFTLLGLQTSAPIVSILFASVLRRELRSSCFHDNLFICWASPTWFLCFFVTRDQPWNLKNHHAAYHCGLEKGTAWLRSWSLKDCVVMPWSGM